MRGLMVLCLVLGLAACDTPPPGSYFKGQTAAQGTAIGANKTGEPCILVERTGGGGDIFCGAWQQASARVRPGGTASGTSLMAVATNSPWRTELEGRFVCSDPQPGSAGTLILQCTRRSGGWAQIAMVTVVGDKVWLADGTPAAFPAIQRAITQLSGGGTVASSSTEISGDIAGYLARESFSAGDIAQYESLMTAGLKANLAGRPDQAETAYRAALALQEKAQGPNSPAAAAALMSVALQLSNRGRFDDAQGFFTRADRAMQTQGAGVLDANGAARLTLYKGLHALNQGDTKLAIQRFTESEAAFRSQQPDARDTPQASGGRVTGAGSRGVSVSEALAGSQPYATLGQKEALLGILESRRNRSVAQRLAGDVAAANATSRSAAAFADANGLTAPLYAARLYRTGGINAAADDQMAPAVVLLGQSVVAFRQAQPRTRPAAEAELAQAALLLRTGRTAEALVGCRAAAAQLHDTKDGVDFEQMQPCLSVYAARAAASVGDSQQLLAEMFAASQLTRGTVTDQEIRRTAVRMAAGDAGPGISEAIRKQQDSERLLGDLLRERDALDPGRSDAAAATRAAELDKSISAARETLAEADGAVQAAAPNYQQLVQQPVTPADVFAALRPGEAFVAINLSNAEGWTFVLRDRRISVARIAGGTPRMTALVKRLRGSIEPGNDNRVPTYDVTAAREIYDLTLGGVAAALEGVTSLTLAPTGPLLSVPFETLLTGPADSQNLATAPFLVRKFVITHVPAASNFVKLRQAAASTASRPWIGFGDFRQVTLDQAVRTYPGDACRRSATILAGLPRLDGTKRELDIASRIFDASPTDQWTGQAFTVNEIKALNTQQKLKNYRILHFAAHALLPSEISCQDEPTIVTSAPAGAANAKGALLSTADIEQLKLDADAVILSACNSGGPGGTTAGESLAGLARSFFYAGARALLVTHWEVQDAEATYLVAVTLNTLTKQPQNGLASALQTAQLTYLARDDLDASFKHPFYWAPFALVGEGGARVVTAALPTSIRTATIAASPSGATGL